jgi:predicted AlkP superfamily phosphohydrolase/phosphomutase
MTLVVVALDSAHPELLLRWVREGTLPTVQSLLERGAHASLTGPETVSAHGVWPSVWSGLSLADHGRYVRRPLLPGTYRLSAASSAAAPPFWTRLNPKGRRVAIIDAPTVGVDEDVDGFQLADWGTHPSGPPPAGRPEGLVSEIDRRFGPPIRTDENQGTRGRDRRVYARILGRIAQKGAIARHLIGQGPFDVIVLGFGDPHAAGHRFWRYGPDATHRTEDHTLRDAIREVYRAVDREIGAVLAALPVTADVFVVTDHGIREGHPTCEWMDGFCRQLGYHVSREAHSGPARLAARSRAAIRAVWEGLRNRWMGASDSVGGWNPASTDWTRTTAFAIPSHYTGLVRVNLRGREPGGVVEPGAQYDALLGRLEADFRQLVYPTTGAAAVEKVTRAVDLFGGAPPARLPDLFVEWRPHGGGERRVAHPRTVLLGRRFGLPRANLHSRTGLVVAAGPNIAARGDAGAISPLDLAPTFLALLGAMPPSLRGRPWAAVTSSGAPRGAGPHTLA